jgi:2-haloacid dehalogenase
MSTPATVVFDIGAVLVDWDPRYLLRKILADETAVERFMAEIVPHEWHLHHDAGVTFAENRAERLKLFPQHRALLEAYDSRFMEMFSGPIHGTVAILEGLRAAGIPTYAITNWPAEKFPPAREMFPFLKGFRGVVVSGDEKLVKPDPRIYRTLFERYGLDPATCVFIDDSPKNVAGSEAVGMKALHFTLPEKLAADLRALGLRW